MTSTIDVFEAIGSQSAKLARAADGDGLTLNYFVRGTTSRIEATEALLDELNSVELLRDGFNVVIADSVDINEIAPGLWEATIEYVPPDKTDEKRQPKAVGEVSFSFDGTGGTYTLTEAFSQQRYGVNAPDHGKSINVSEGSVEGVEIVIPQLSFTLSQRFDGATITLPWLRSVIFATGTVNADEFLGFAPGEVLFLGPSGQQPIKFMDNGTVAAGERDVEFRFAVSPNLRDLNIGGIEVTQKAGHDYLWIQYEETEDSEGKALTRKPIGVYVAQVYRRTPFAALRISNPEINFPVAGA
jgi:hypothetical protein